MDSIRLLPDPFFVSERVVDDSLAVDAFLPEIFWAPRPAEEDWMDEAIPPRVEWDSDSDGRGPLSRKGLPVDRVVSASAPNLLFFLVSSTSCFMSLESESVESNKISILDFVLESTFALIAVVGNALESCFALFLFEESPPNSESISNNDMDDLQLPILIVSAAFRAACR